MSFLTPPTIPQITSPLTSKCISLIAFPVFILGAGVSVLRIREHRYFSISNDPLSRLTKIYRAHAVSRALFALTAQRNEKRKNNKAENKDCGAEEKEKKKA